MDVAASEAGAEGGGQDAGGAEGRPEDLGGAIMRIILRTPGRINSTFLGQWTRCWAKDEEGRRCTVSVFHAIFQRRSRWHQSGIGRICGWPVVWDLKEQLAFYGEPPWRSIETGELVWPRSYKGRNRILARRTRWPWRT